MNATRNRFQRERRPSRSGARLRIAAIATAAALATLSACAAQDSPEALLDKARQSIAANEPRTAEIHLKNLLEAGDNGEARYLLGQLHEGSGDMASAEKEYRRALDLGYQRALTLPALMRALLALGQAQKVLDLSHDMKLENPAAKADALTSAGQALLRLGKIDEARRTLDEAIAAAPDSIPAQVWAARMQATVDRKAAREKIDAMLAKHPDALEALALRADLDLMDGRRDAAREALLEIVRREPRRPDILAKLAGIEIEAGNLDAARTHQAELAKVAPNHVLTHHLKAMIEARTGQFQLARESVNQALRLSPDYLPSISLAAAVHLHLNELEQAERHARRLVDREPQSVRGPRLLGSTYLKMNAPERALEAVRRPLERGEQDATLLAIAGEASLKLNDAAAAAKYFERASKLDPKDSRKLTGLAMSHLAAGNRDVAIDELEAAVALDSGSLQADIVLITTLTRDKRYDQALEAVVRMAKKAPNSPLPSMMRGSVLAAKGDFAGARRAWEEALRRDAKYFPAAASLAAADLREGKRDDARKRYESIVAADPKNSQAWVAMAGIAAQGGAPRTAVLDLLKKAREANPASMMPVQATARYLIETDTAAEAVPLLQEAHNADRDNVQILDMLAGALLRSGQPGQAIATWERLLRIEPKAWAALIRIGEAHRASGQNDLALASFAKAAEIAPNAVEPQIAMASAMHALGRKDEARRLADKLRGSKQHAFAGELLRADLAAADKDWNGAIDGYRRAFEQQKTVLAGTQLHRALRAGGRENEADSMLRGWVKSEPQNLPVRMYAGEVEIAGERWKQALDHYSVVLDKEPNNAIALNNAAYALYKTKNDRAEDYARRAWEAAPRSAAILDTYGVILSEKGDPKGIGLLREAVGASPKNALIRLHLAEALLRAGDKSAARTEVGTVLETAPTGPVADAAKALQARL